ncbi:hypothetical protein FN846DRAFT_998382 [Sphaerosporella brunnea]|uniref:Uncharacterized protein n=1 Tax=Sphaerosporella brunnea TaxID=1250544 RepID=A0A5J5FBV1_9PEZI|nr:hypothetical protein FN846DRAFT_998382 [Sphaerosporella brunnea]
MARHMDAVSSPRTPETVLESSLAIDPPQLLLQWRQECIAKVGYTLVGAERWRSKIAWGLGGDSASSVPPESRDSTSAVPPASADSASSGLPASRDSASSVPPASRDSASSVPPASGHSTSSAPPASGRPAAKGAISSCTEPIPIGEDISQDDRAEAVNRWNALPTQITEAEAATRERNRQARLAQADDGETTKTNKSNVQNYGIVESFKKYMANDDRSAPPGRALVIDCPEDKWTTAARDDSTSSVSAVSGGHLGQQALFA